MYTLLMAIKPPQLKNILVIVEMMLALSPCSATCERGFSTLNVAKNPLRSTLKQENLTNQMLLMIEGPEVKDFDPNPVVDLWYFGTSGGRHTEGHNRPIQSDQTENASVEDIMDMTKGIPVEW